MNPDAIAHLADQWPFAAALILIVLSFLGYLLKRDKSISEDQRQAQGTFERALDRLVSSEEKSHETLTETIRASAKETTKTKEAVIELVTHLKASSRSA